MIEFLYLAYLAISVAIILWVGRAFDMKARTFLIDTFGGNETAAKSLSRLLTVGFYLVTISHVLLTLRHGLIPNTLANIAQLFSTKIGWLLLVLAAANYFNVWLMTKIRRQAIVGDAVILQKPKA